MGINKPLISRDRLEYLYMPDDHQFTWSELRSIEGLNWDDVHQDIFLNVINLEQGAESLRKWLSNSLAVDRHYRKLKK